MTSINTQRLHLNTDDGIQNDNGNHANTTFNLAKANIGCLSNQLLSVSLIKAVLPITLDAIGYNQDDKIAFTMKIVDSNFVDQVLNCYITRNTLDIPPYNATRPTEFKFPITYLDSPITLQDTLNEILASQYAGSSGLKLIITPSSGRTVVQFDSGTVTELVFDNSFVVAGRANYNKPGQRLFTALGINTFDNLEMGQLISAETIFKGGNGGIDAGTNVDLAFQLSLFHPPLNLVSNLGLDSASSNSGGSRNNILAGIQIEVEDQSRGIECTHIGGDAPLGGDAPPDPDPPSLFNGVPADTQAFSIFNATYYIFYKDYKYYIHNFANNTTAAGVAFGAGTSVMTEIPTGQTINMGYVNPSNDSVYLNVGTNWYKYSYTLSNGVASFTFVYVQTNAWWFGSGWPNSGWTGSLPQSNADNMRFYNNGTYDPTFTQYGGTGQQFNGLPHNLGGISIRKDDTLKGWAFKGDKYYELSITYSETGIGTSLIGLYASGGALVSSGTLPSASVSSVSASVSSSATGTTLVVSKSSSLINHINYSVGASHKIVSSNSVSTLNLILESADGDPKFCDGNIYYEIEFKTYDTLS